MDQRRTRGRPRGSAIKPYAKRIPKVIGCPDDADDDLTPTERRQVRTYYALFEQERQRLCALSRQGDSSAAQKLWTQFHVIVPVLAVQSLVNSFMAGMRFATTPG